jgi:hypothetical protein
LTGGSGGVSSATSPTSSASALKYDDDLTPETDACLEKLREEVFRLLEDHGLNLYDE